MGCSPIGQRHAPLHHHRYFSARCKTHPLEQHRAVPQRRPAGLLVSRLRRAHGRRRARARCPPEKRGQALGTGFRDGRHARLPRLQPDSAHRPQGTAPIVLDLGAGASLGMRPAEIQARGRLPRRGCAQVVVAGCRATQAGAGVCQGDEAALRRTETEHSNVGRVRPALRGLAAEGGQRPVQAADRLDAPHPPADAARRADTAPALLGWFQRLARGDLR